jgi:hypothetical protein
MIDIIIPTMWMAKTTTAAIQKYCKNPKIHKIILVDNNSNKRPPAFSEIMSDPKIEYVSYGKNIYVNPAWNEGYFRSTSEIIAIINDDIMVEDDVFDLVLDHNLKPGDLVGVNLRGYQDNYKIDDHIETKEEIIKLNYDRTSPIGGQLWAFGICMFMHRNTYKVIPSLYQIWYGDDYLAQSAKNVYGINSNRIKGNISETLKKFNNPNDDVSKRIELDSKNFLTFSHFYNEKKWDLPKNMIEKYESQRKSITQNKQDIFKVEHQPKSTTQHKQDVFEVEYQRAKKTPSDINQNLPVLYELAKECETIVEMGVRTGVSTRAFLNTDAALMSIDIKKNTTVEKLFALANAGGKSCQYIINDVLQIEISETDLLFIDTLHTYEQLTQELKLHGNKAKKYLIFHDTHTFGVSGENGIDKRGLMPAIIEFLIANPHWSFYIHKTNNNGLTVLKRL